MKLQARNFVVRKPETVDITALRRFNKNVKNYKIRKKLVKT